MKAQGGMRISSGYVRMKAEGRMRIKQLLEIRRHGEANLSEHFLGWRVNKLREK
jgi:hypothetical protein